MDYCTVVCMGGWLLGCICPCFFFCIKSPVGFLVYPEVSLALVLSRANGCQVVVLMHFLDYNMCVNCDKSVSINCFSTHGIQSRRGQLGFMACIYLFIRNCKNRSKCLSAKAGHCRHLCERVSWRQRCTLGWGLPLQDLLSKF